jgi:hypothetical protein
MVHRYFRAPTYLNNLFYINLGKLIKYFSIATAIGIFYHTSTTHIHHTSTTLHHHVRSTIRSSPENPGGDTDRA